MSSSSETPESVLWRHVEDERRSALALLESLTTEEWDAPSLCDGWRVRDVAAHMLVDEPLIELGPLEFFGRLVGWRFNIHKANDWWVEHCAAWPVERLTQRFAASVVPGRVSRIMGPVVVWKAAVIHHADMWVPLDRAPDEPAEGIAVLLDALMTPAGSANVGTAERAAGLALVASDVDWRHGSGPLVVEGPAMSLVLALAGRSVGLENLSGPGVQELATRVQTPVAALSGSRVVRLLAGIRRRTADSTS